MKKVVLFLLLHCSMDCKSQNLVPNASFEYHTNCPWMEGQIFYAAPWVSATFGGTPDYYNACSPGFNVPLAYGGYQLAKTGFAFAGLYGYVFYPPYFNIREYIEAELTDTLRANSWYCISFYCNLAEQSSNAIDRLGLYISDTVMYSTDTSYFPVNPQIENQTGNFLSDKVNWMQISGLYQAQGGEKFITIGNFRSDTLTDTLAVTGGMYPFAYYFIEDVSVINCDSLMGINDFENYGLKIYPNPATDFINIESKQHKKLTLKIFDLLGKEMLSVVVNGNAKVNVQQLAQGVYVYRVYDGERVLKTGKLLKE